MFVFDGSSKFWLGVSCDSLVRDITSNWFVYMKYLVSCSNIQEVYIVTTFIVCLYKQERQSVSTVTHT